MNDNNFISSTFSRLFRLGETAGRIGYVLVKNLGKNFNIDVDQITKVVDNLSRLKGAPMKVGQMLSLHEDLLPPEIVEIFKVLQKDSNPMSFTVIEEILQRELKEKLGDFSEISRTPFASASIGQVHKAKLRNGQEVVLKIQYPGIRKAIDTDLKTIKIILSPLFKALNISNFDIIWEEIQERLHEEVNYIHEMNNIKIFKEKFQIKNLVIPTYYEEYITEEVLTLSFEESYPLEIARKKNENLQKIWLNTILKLVTLGFYKYHFLHVDPNAANFGFRDNGSVVLYDFGCIKKIPEKLSEAYKNVSLAIFKNDFHNCGKYLAEVGMKMKNGEPIIDKFLYPHLELIAEIFPDKETYFGENAELYKKLLEIVRNSWQELNDIIIPKDVVFVHRNLIGHFGNLRKFKVKDNWRKVILSILEQT